MERLDSITQDNQNLEEEEKTVYTIVRKNCPDIRIMVDNTSQMIVTAPLQVSEAQIQGLFSNPPTIFILVVVFIIGLFPILDFFVFSNIFAHKL